MNDLIVLLRKYFHIQFNEYRNNDGSIWSRTIDIQSMYDYEFSNWDTTASACFDDNIEDFEKLKNYLKGEN